MQGNAVTLMPMFDPGQGRGEVFVKPGMTILEIVNSVLPDIPPALMGRIRIVLVTAGSMLAPDQKFWRSMRLKPGVRLLVRIVPAGDNLKPILLAVVAVAAIALGQYYAVPLLGGLISASVTGALITAGVSVLGNLLVNALVPTRVANAGAGLGAGASGGDAAEIGGSRSTYSISGWRNTLTVGGVVPILLGGLRFAPQLAAPSYTEIVGDEQYIRAKFLLGYGEMAISDIRIGETPLANFSDVSIEVRTGTLADTKTSIYKRQVIEDSLGGVDLRYEPAKNSVGEYSGPAVYTPFNRITATDVTSARIIIGFPAGLVQYNDLGKESSVAVTFKIRFKEVNSANWINLNNWTVRNKKREGFFRTIFLDFPTRGTYEVEFGRISLNADSNQVLDRATYIALQSNRPEYPINMDTPLALIDVRARATYQLNSALDNLNLFGMVVCLDWDSATQTWIKRATSNPASLYRHVLQSNASSRPVADSGIDLTILQDWHDFCVLKGLKYNRMHDFEGSLEDALADVAHAGRAAPRNDGKKYAVVIDRDQPIVFDQANDRNSRDFSWTRQYTKKPDGFRVSFLDETNDYKPAERVIPWPGYVGDIGIAEELSLPGVTNPDAIWREARRRMYEAIHRTETYSFVQDGSARIVTRGDRIKASFNTLDKTHESLRVRAVDGNLVELDGVVTMVQGQSYAIRYRADLDQLLPSSTVRAISTIEGDHRSVIMIGDGAPPVVDEIIMFGLAGIESTDMLVIGVEAGNDMTSVMHCIPYAPIIDQLTDAEVPPVWTGRVGDIGPPNTTKPGIPVITSIITLSAFDGFQIDVVPAKNNDIAVLEFIIEYKLSSSGVWNSQTFLAGTGGEIVTGYSGADVLDIRLTATGTNGIDSDVSAVVNFTIGTAEPAPSVPVSATATGGMGKADLTIVASSSSNLVTIPIYRGTQAAFATSSKVVSLPGYPSATITHIDGDGSRVNQTVNAEMSVDTDWAKGTGWSIAGGKANKAAGTAAELTQPAALTIGKTIRFSLIISGRTAGTVRLAFQGGTTVQSGAFNTDGQHLGKLTTVSGNDTLAIAADAAFDGSVDGVIWFEETEACAPQGTIYYFTTSANGVGTESANLAFNAITIV